MRHALAILVLAVPATLLAQGDPLEPTERALRQLGAELHDSEMQLRRISWDLHPPQATIYLRSRLGPLFDVARARLKLDGSPLPAPEGRLVYRGLLSPGPHELEVTLELRGDGLGLFPYHEGYRYEVRAAHRFSVTEGDAVQIDVVAYERGDLTTPVTERPAIRFVAGP